MLILFYKYWGKLFFIVAFVVLPRIVKAQLPLRLPSIISNHAVMQKSSLVKLWGWGPGSFTVNIICSWSKYDTIKIPIDATCEWSTMVKTPSAAGPYDIDFMCGNQRISVKDILMGEVWLCSGQSNMEFNFRWGVSDTGNVLPTAKNNGIRFFQVQQNYNKFPQIDCNGSWVECDSNSASNFSVIGYLFGRHLNDRLKEPVGLIGSYWGGTGIQAWIPQPVFDNNFSLRQWAIHIEPYGWAPKGTSLLYNAMIFPITGYTLSGIVWYQGEANVDREYNAYNALFKAMINSWRVAFDKDLPFYFVQVAPWNGYKGIRAALLREQQEMALRLPKTGMVVTSDLVDDTSDIHPRHKSVVALRLANLALREVYGYNSINPYSPNIIKCIFHKGSVYITIKSVGKLSVLGDSIVGFQVAGFDKVFHLASGFIDNNGRVVVESKLVSLPTAVRYCFTNTTIPNLFDTNGLPLTPYRSDSWDNY